MSNERTGDYCGRFFWRLYHRFTEVGYASEFPPRAENAYVFPRRYFVTFLLAILLCLQGLTWNTWGPISESVFEGCTNWSPRTIALLSNWSNIVFVLLLWPMLHMNHIAGLRTCVIFASVILTMATMIRSLTAECPSFDTLRHTSAILIGVAGTVTSCISSQFVVTWFPHYQRTSALAFCQAALQFGALLAFFQPLSFSYFPKTEKIMFDVGTLSENNEEIKENIRETIHGLSMYTMVPSIILMAILVGVFPSKPPTPPSVSSWQLRLDFKHSFKSMFLESQNLLLMFAYGACVGIPSVWLSVLNISLSQFGMHQNEVMLVGSQALACSIFIGWLTARFTDKVFGTMKIVLIILNLFAITSFGLFLCLSLGYITPMKWQIYASVILGIGSSLGAIPLYLELAVENAYPCSEVVAAGVLTGAKSLVGMCFLFGFFFATEDFTWIAYCLAYSSPLALASLVFVQGNYHRSSIDRSGFAFRPPIVDVGVYI